MANLTFGNTLSSNPGAMSNALFGKMQSPVSLSGQNFGVQSSTPAYAKRAAPTATQQTYGQNLGSTTGSYGSAPAVGTSQTKFQPTTYPQTTGATTPLYPSLVNGGNQSAGGSSQQTQPQTTQPTPDVPQQPQPTPPNSLYNQYVQGLGNSANSPYNQTAQQNIGNISGAAAGNIALGQKAQDIASAAGQRISDIGGQGARGEAGFLTTGTSPVASGNAGVVAQTTAAEQQAVAQGANMQLAGTAQGLTAQNQAEQGYNAAAGQALSGQGTQQGALGAAAGYTAPQPYGLTTQPYFPGSDQYGGGGTGGAINRSIQASNIGSAGDFESQIQNTQATANAANANFDILNSYALGFAGDSPILNGITQKYGTTVQGNNAVAGFKAQLQNVRAAYQAITGGDGTAAIPDTITPNQLKQVQQALSSTAQNKVAGFQNQLKTLGGNSQSSGNSTFGGSAWK